MKNLFLIVLIVVASMCCKFFFCEQGIAGNIYYVDSQNGSDEKAGSLSAPWGTIQESISKLRPGDTLFLRSGTYYESKIVINIQGTESNKITIKNYPNEVAVIDGGYREFRAVPNSDWEVYDFKKNIYRSVKSYPKADGVHGYFSKENGNYRLISYEKYNDLSADNEEYTNVGEIYVGPGIFWNRSDKKIYVRLKPGKQQISMGYNIPSNTDPRSTALNIFPSHEIILFGQRCSYVDIEGIDLRYQNNTLEYLSGSHHISLKNFTITGGRTPIIIRDNVHNLVFDGISVYGNIPPWIVWSDVKIGSIRPAHLFQGPAILVRNFTHHIEIKNGTFENTWDGVDVGGSSNNLHIHHNIFKGIRDDVVQLGSGCYDIEINHNKMLLVSKGISRHGSGTPAKPGTKYIHHNIIDCSRAALGGRYDPKNLLKGKYRGPLGDGRVWARPFGSHEGDGFGKGDPWKIYNNTIVFGKELNNKGAGHEYCLKSFYPDIPQEVYNNIFIQTMDHWFASGSRVADGSQIYDGNIYFRTATNSSNSFFKSWEDKGRSKNFKNLAEFKSSPYFHSTKKYYLPGWENSGVETNPQLDDEYRPSPNSLAAKGAVPLPARWPGQDGGKYRGALPPDTSSKK